VHYTRTIFSTEDRILIKNLVLLNGYSSRRLMKKFPQKDWNKNGLDALATQDSCDV